MHLSAGRSTACSVLVATAAPASAMLATRRPPCWMNAQLPHHLPAAYARRSTARRQMPEAAPATAVKSATDNRDPRPCRRHVCMITTRGCIEYADGQITSKLPKVGSPATGRVTCLRTVLVPQHRTGKLICCVEHKRVDNAALLYLTACTVTSSQAK